MGEQQLAKPAARSRKDVLPLLPMPPSSIARSVCRQLHNRQICSTQFCPAGFSLEDTQAASVCISPSSLTWRLAGFDGLVPEGHGLRWRAFVEVFVGLVGGVVA